jgi:ubiquinone/menaquinone biosynthesis C-methylase UbiE
VSSLVGTSRDAVTGALGGVAQAWAGAPSGPLGWVCARWVMPRWHAPIYTAMAAAVRPQPEDEMLEVACGSGIFLAEHAAVVRYVAGLDLSDIQVGMARQRMADRLAAGTAEIVQGDVGALPWPDERFTVVTCMGSFEAFADPAQALAEMHRVLRPGGRAVLCIGEHVPPGTQTHQTLDRFWVWAEDDVRDMVQVAGFTDVDISYLDYSGDSRLSRFLSGPDLRLVRAAKQQATGGRDQRRTRTPLLARGTVR